MSISPAGTYLPPGATAPIADPVEGTYSAAGATAPTEDPATARTRVPMRWTA